MSSVPTVLVGALTACVVRRGLTGQKSAEVVVPGQGMCVVGLGRTEREVERPSWCLLVEVTVIAAIPLRRACRGRRR